MARTFKGYVSAYSANQRQSRMVRRSQVRVVTVDFNGALPVDVLIDNIRWDCTSPWITYMETPQVAANQRSANVKVTFNYSGIGNVKATATMDDGSVQNYEFEFTVTDAPIYPEAQYQSYNGPYSVSADAA